MDLHLDDVLVDKAVELGGHTSKREAVILAIEEYVSRLEQERILSLFGAIEFDRDYDHKAQRRRP